MTSQVCKSPLDLDAIARCEEQASGQGGAAGARGAWAACRRQLRMACQAAQELFHSHGSIPQLAFRCGQWSRAHFWACTFASFQKDWNGGFLGA